MGMKLFCRQAAPVAVLLLLLHSTTAQAAPTVGASDRAALQTDLNGDAKVNRGDTLRHTIIVGNSGDSAAADTNFSETLDPGTTLVPGSVKSTPLAVNDSYSAIGNMRIQVPAAAGLLKNDFGLPLPTAAVVAAGTSAQGGNLTVNADGGFTYNPPAGFTGTDSFSYTVSNSQGSDTGTVSITVSGMVWFVNSAAGTAGDGRLTSPFSCLVGTGCYSASSKRAAGDTIFLYSGSYTGALTLLASQKLIGQGAAASLAAISGLTPGSYSDPFPATGGTRPTIASGGLTLAAGNTLRGFDITSSPGTAISGTNFGTLTAGEMSLSSSGSALSLTNGTLNNASFTSVTSGGGTNNLSLSAVSGTLVINGGTWSGATGAACLVSGGNADISYSGAISKSTTGRLVDIQSRSGGSVVFGGDLTCSAPCSGIYVRNNSLTGTLTITGSNNTLGTTNAEALHVENTSIAATGLTFRSISANGGDYGIYLNNTGSAGGLTITGDNGGSANGSGGTITNIARRGASFFNTAKVSLGRMNFTNTGTQNSGSSCGDLGAGSTSGCNAAVHLENVTDATLNLLALDGGSQQGINGSNVTNFHLVNSKVQNFGDQAGEDGVRIQNLLGTSEIAASTISNNRSRQVNIKNLVGTPLVFTMNGSTLENPSAGTNGEYLMQFSGQNSANMRATIQGSVFRNNPALAGGFQSNSVGTAAMNLTIDNSTFTSLNAASIDIVQAESANVAFNVTNNTLTDNAQGNLINVYRAGSSVSGKTLAGKILNNTLGNPGNASVIGSAAGSGIAVSSLGSGTTTVQVDGNRVSRVTQHGIYVGLQENNSGTNTVNATVNNNQISNYNSATVGFHGIMVQSGTTGAPGPEDAGTLCASISGNNSVNGPNFNPLDQDNSSNHAIRVRQRYLTSFRMPGYPGSNNDNAAVVSFIRGNNSATAGWISATNNVAGGGAGFLNSSFGIPCPLP